MSIRTFIVWMAACVVLVLFTLYLQEKREEMDRAMQTEIGP